MTGLRLGYMAVADAALRDRVRKLLFFTTSNVSSVVQYGGIGALEGSQDVVEQYRAELRGAARPLLRGHRIAAAASWRGGRRPERSTRSCKFDPDWKARRAKAPDVAQRRGVGPARGVRLVGTDRVPDRRRADRLHPRRRLRPRRRGLPALLLRARSRRTRGRAGVAAGVVRVTICAAGIGSRVRDVVVAHYLMCRPPSTRITSPVMKSVSISATTALAISAPPPHRPSGVAFSTASNSASGRSGGARIGPGRDRVDEDLIGRQLERQRLGQADHRLLRHVVRQEALVAGAPAHREPVREVDDAAAAGGRMWGTAARAQRNADDEVDVEAGLQVVGRHLVERDRRGRPTPC